MEFFSTISQVVTESGFEGAVYQGRMYASGGMKGAKSGKRIAVIPSLSINVLQKQLTDSYHEYIWDVLDEIKKLRDNNNKKCGVNYVPEEEAWAMLISHYKDLKGKCVALNEKCIALRERDIAKDIGNIPQSWMNQAAVDREHTCR